MSEVAPQFQRRIQMGLGEAIRRMVHLEINHANGYDISPAVAAESKMIMDALNVQYQLDLGFDCDNDGVPDTVEIFARSAETSCCRILPMDERPKKARGKSRATKSEPTLSVVEPAPEPAPAAAPEPSPESSPAAPDPAPEATGKKGKKSKGFLSSLFGND